jgi:hypothetical protein
MFDQVELVLCWVNKFLVGYGFWNLNETQDKVGGKGYLSIHSDYHFDETTTQDLWGCGDLAYVKNFQATKCFRKKDPHKVEERITGTAVRGLAWTYKNTTVLATPGWFPCYNAERGKSFLYSYRLEEQLPSNIKPTRKEMMQARKYGACKASNGWWVGLVPDTRWITI